MATYQKQDPHANVKSSAEIPLRSRYTRFFSFETNLKQLIDRKFRALCSREEDLLLTGSGWSFVNILEIHIEIAELHGINEL